MRSPTGEIKNPGLYVFRWLDILADPAWNTKPIAEAQPATCVTCGWLVFSDDKKVILADSKSRDGDFGGLTIIPAGVIIERTRLSGRGPDSFMKD